MMFKKIFESRGFSAVSLFFIWVGIVILAVALSLAWFTFGYWLITLILPTFFGVTIPFSWSYALGGWLIAIIIGSFVTPLLKVNIHNNN